MFTQHYTQKNINDTPSSRLHLFFAYIMFIILLKNVQISSSLKHFDIPNENNEEY